MARLKIIPLGKTSVKSIKQSKHIRHKNIFKWLLIASMMANAALALFLYRI